MKKINELEKCKIRIKELSFKQDMIRTELKENWQNTKQSLTLRNIFNQFIYSDIKRNRSIVLSLFFQKNIQRIVKNPMMKSIIVLMNRIKRNLKK